MRFQSAPAIFLFFIIVLVFPSELFAATASELQEKIDDRNKKIADLEREISQYEKDLAGVSKEKQTLQNTIATLDTTRKKLVANIALTENRIAAKDLEIEGLSDDISDTRATMERQKESVAESMRELSLLDDTPLSISVLGETSLSSFFDDFSRTISFRERLRENLERLASLKSDLEDSKKRAERKRAELAALKRDLSDQKTVLEANRTEKNKLLKETQNKESTYQILLAEKRALAESFAAELRELEQDLRITIDPASIPRYGSGVLSWPVTSVYITQYFGNTPFATQNPQVYSGRGHNGIDLRASVGTPIKASLGGIVRGIGDTDMTCPGASYGKWVLIEHGNGLTTLSAHLSHIRVSQGERVETGQTIGLSGNTGYSTGPHLHFSVYASQGVVIKQFPSKSTFCKGKVYILPVADPKAYLNPLSYL